LGWQWVENIISHQNKQQTNGGGAPDRKIEKKVARIPVTADHKLGAKKRWDEHSEKSGEKKPRKMRKAEFMPNGKRGR